MRHGGQILTDHLSAQGVRRVFSVPGESFLAALDGLHDSGIANVVCRHEGGAAMMADAHGKMTGSPGIAFVTRGPGAANASAGIHVARQDSTPMILFVGQVARADRDREAFQELDLRAMFAPLAKWVAEVDDTARLPEYLSRAFHTAQSGRPGPVVLSLPEDMLSGLADVADAPVTAAATTPDLSGPAQEAVAWLSAAERPLVIAGGPHWSQRAADELGRFAAVQGVPVALGFRRQDYLDNAHACYAGDLNVGMNPALAKRLRAADRLLVIGSRLGDIETRGYTLLPPAVGRPALFHVHADADEIGRVFPAERSVVARAPDFVAALSRCRGQGGDWAGWTAGARTDYLDWATPQPVPAPDPGPARQEAVISWLSENLPSDAILTNGAGNYAAFLHRYYRFRRHGTQLAPTSGSMGYGFPAAVSAALEYPDRCVVCLAGDGCFQMTLNEMSTAVQHGAALIVVVINNGQYGTIRMHQERSYPGRVSGTRLANPDFAALARAYGGHGEAVGEIAAFGPAFERARASRLAAVIDVAVDPRAISTTATLDQLRAAAAVPTDGSG